MIKSLLVSFFAACYRSLDCNNICFKVKTNRQSILQSFQHLFEYIDKNYYFIDFNTAADFMHFTPSYFSRVFKSIAGTTFSEYLNLVKIQKALEMIKEGSASITQISSKCGFDSTRNFNRVFKKLTGLTPTEITNDFTLKHLIHTKSSADESFNPTIHISKLVEQA